MSYEDKMYSTAMNILERREDQLMHYGRKGMKWGKEIFGEKNEQKQSGGNWGNNAFTNTVNDPKYNPIKKAQLEKRKEDLLSRAYESKPIKGSNGIKGTSHYTHGGDHDPMRPDWQGELDYSNMSPYTSNRVSQETAGGREIVTRNDPKFTYKTTTQNGLQVPKINKEYYNPNEGYYHTDRDVQPRINQQESIKKYGSQQDDFTDEDRKRGQEVRKQQAEERYNKNKAERMNEYEAIKPIKEGKTGTVLVGEDDALPVQPRGVQGPQRFFNPLADIAGVKDPFYTAQASEITPYTDSYRDATFKYQDANGVRKDNLEKQNLRQTQNEQIAKYGNQQPEKNDEQKIAERARGQYIREEQAAQRKAELEKKKQELLNKAYDEKAARYLKDRPTGNDKLTQIAQKTAGGRNVVDYIGYDGEPAIYDPKRRVTTT